ncbi:MAG: hypothetical protein HUJ58_04720, partial [Erysipelotrichaceae bacterium]|nr:hypothetical protein [Erysipelotrichaceae bacterium]
MKKVWKALGDIFFEAEEDDEEDVIVQEVDPDELEEIPFVQMPAELKKTEVTIPPIPVTSAPMPKEEPAESADIPFTVATAKPKAEPEVQPVEKPVMPVMPVQEKKTYEFTRVISPTTGLKDAATESPKVVIPSV